MAETAEAAKSSTPGPYQFHPRDLFSPRFAPDNLSQIINPWNWIIDSEQFGLVNISIGETKYPELERKILDDVGSYGRQLGHIGDVLEVLMGLVDETRLDDDQRDTLLVLKGELAEIRKIKRRHLKEK